MLLFVLAAPAPAQAETVEVNCHTPTSDDTCSRWYSSASVSLTWAPDPLAGSAVQQGCVDETFTQETPLFTRFCRVRWDSTNTTVTREIWIGIDRTAPRMTGLQTARPPDHDGWFNHPVLLAFTASDAISGVDRCTTLVYSGPSGAVAGRCTDAAGNTASGSVPLRYDATSPPEPSATARPGNRRVRVEWTPAPNAQAEVTRRRRGRSRVVYRGPGDSFLDRRLRNGRRYRYVVSLIDQAGNRSTDSASAVPTSSRLLTPPAGARLSSPPLLSWRKVRRASYYNVQLLRGRRKVLSRWPTANELQLTRRWRFAGERRRLVAGRYCYFVWPGFGPRARRDYGEVLGRRCFRVIS